MVPQRDLVDAPLRQRRMQAASPQLGAQGAGVLFFPLVEHDVVYRHGDTGIGHIQRGAVVGHGGEIHAGHARLQRDGLHLKGQGIERAQARQRRQRQQAVLTAGNAHGHRFTGFDHVIVLHTAADKSQYMLHGQASFIKTGIAL